MCEKAQIRTYIHLCMHACMHIYIYSYLHTYMQCASIARASDYHPGVALFFVSYMLLVFLVLVNIVLAVLLDEFLKAADEEKKSMSASVNHKQGQVCKPRASARWTLQYHFVNHALSMHTVGLRPVANRVVQVMHYLHVYLQVSTRSLTHVPMFTSHLLSTLACMCAYLQEATALDPFLEQLSHFFTSVELEKYIQTTFKFLDSNDDKKVSDT